MGGEEGSRGRKHLYRLVTPPGTNVRHLYLISRPVQMLNLICTHLCRMVLYRLDTLYK
jgi:hypothetical protein